MLKENKGITLIALITTIIILVILAGVAVYTGQVSINTAKDNTRISELEMVQHAVLERYSKYKLTNDSLILVGTPISTEEAENIARQMDRALSRNNEGTTYYRLNSADLNDLGIKTDTDTEYSYIINYETGEVMNEKILKTKSGEALYITAK